MEIEIKISSIRINVYISFMCVRVACCMLLMTHNVANSALQACETKIVLLEADDATVSTADTAQQYSKGVVKWEEISTRNTPPQLKAR